MFVTVNESWNGCTAGVEITAYSDDGIEYLTIWRPWIKWDDNSVVMELSENGIEIKPADIR